MTDEPEMMDESFDIPSEEEKPLAAPSLTSLADLPLTVHVEMARFSITLEKLSQLSSGNVIELDIPANQAVHLVINGKRVAKAELMQLGEIMGVRILEIGAPS